MRPIGKRQLEHLLGLASPSCLMVVGDAVSKTLVVRGLLKPHFSDNPDAWPSPAPIPTSPVNREAFISRERAWTSA